MRFFAWGMGVLENERILAWALGRLPSALNTGLACISSTRAGLFSGIDC